MERRWHGIWLAEALAQREQVSCKADIHIAKVRAVTPEAGGRVEQGGTGSKESSKIRNPSHESI